MFSRYFPLYFVVILSGLVFFSPNQNPAIGTEEIPYSKISLNGVFNLPEEDIDLLERYIPFIIKYAEDKEVSIPLVLAVIKAESNFQTQAVSRKGALGLMQLMPSTALWEYQKSGLDAPMHQLSENLRSQPELNIALGVQHIERLQNKLEGINDSENLRKLVIASYNAGVHRVKRAFKCKGFDCYKYKANHYGKNYFKKSIRSLPAETRHYLRTVETYYQQFKDALNDKPIAASLTT